MLLRRLGLVLAAACGVLLFGASAPAQKQSFDADEKRAIETLIRDYLLTHPEIIREAVQVLQQRERQAELDHGKAAVALHLKELTEDPTAPVLGNAAGDVTIVEFFDYRCPYCKQMEPSLAELLGEDGKVRLVMKEFPILGPDSVIASRAALASRAQGRYQPFHSAMMGSKGALDEAAIFRTAGEVGLDVARLKRDMASAEIDEILKRNHDLAAALGVGGTPAFVIGKQFVPGALDKAALKSLVAEARSQE
ncbi:MAG: DsbA family protein [Proteobacteria bacterium]|nr:DsbA family protein [Pseudomonadota bacterium]MBI3497997.1 DsbA family protein [Pseudomonadota bacterium]